jgi:dihydroorotase
MKLLIKNGRLVDPASGTDATLDVLIEDGKFAAVDKSISSRGVEVFDATGMVVAPGFIDMHVHLREPGFERKETIATGLAAALAGGFTGVACMPNTNPVNDCASVTNYILNRAKASSPVAVYPIGSVTQGQKGEDLSLFAELQEAGAAAFSDDGLPVKSSKVMRRALEYAGSLGMVVIDHCEDLDLAHGGSINEGKVSARLGLRGIPAEAEVLMIRRDLTLARMTGQRVHIAHVSTKLGVDVIRVAKKRRVPVTAEATPHHFSLTEDSVASFDSNYKMNPPLRTKEDVDAVIEGLADGTLDAIVTDHAPHAYEEKLVEFDRAPNGIIGLQTAVPLAIDKLVLPDKISLKRLVDAFSCAPARILGLNEKGRVAPGLGADLTIFSLRKETLLRPQDIKSLSKNSPFLNQKIRGAVIAAVIGGIIYPVKE